MSLSSSSLSSVLSLSSSMFVGINLASSRISAISNRQLHHPYCTVRFELTLLLLCLISFLCRFLVLSEVLVDSTRLLHVLLGTIHKGRPAKTRISRPLSPLHPDKIIESHSNNNWTSIFRRPPLPRGQPDIICEWPLSASAS